MQTLEKYGFKFGQNGAHSARSMMSEELRSLFAASSSNTPKEQYQSDIIEHNLLDKPTAKSRSLTFRHLVDLYGLTNDIPLFRVFRKLWPIEPGAQPLLALQLALARDPLLRSSISTITESDIGSIITRGDIEEILKASNPERFSPASLKSFAQNINGSWTQAGYLQGRSKKHRRQPKGSPVNVAFALFLAYLEGATGERLLHNAWSQLLGLSEHQHVELAIAASHRGMIDFKQSGGVTEVRFTGFLTAEEEQQAIGWNPDINDGVRPFMTVSDVNKKGAGILRTKPNIHWKKDRGKDVATAPWYKLGLEYEGKEGDRINDHHLSLEEKHLSRQETD